MNVAMFPVGAFQTNCVIAWGASCKAVLFDPGDDAHTIAAFLDAHGLDVAAYVLTHGHVDHVSALAALHGERPAPLAIHAADRDWAFTPENAMPPFYAAPAAPDAIERKLFDGGEWTDGDLAYRVIETPGHTPGSVCLHFPADDVLVAGDTLFAGSVGRTDLPRGDSRTLSLSLLKLADLPETTAVYPGHGPQTSIADELRTNYFLQAAAARAGRQPAETDAPEGAS